MRILRKPQAGGHRALNGEILGILATNTGGYALLFWLPTAVQNLLAATGREATSTAVFEWLSLVFLCDLAGVWVSGQSSDRSGDRKWHCVAGQVLAGLFLGASLIPGLSWGWVFAFLCLVGFFAYFWPSPFWVLPTLTLSASVPRCQLASSTCVPTWLDCWGRRLLGR
jgi:ACS family tartrate transporter-like MFS transporter